MYLGSLSWLAIVYFWQEVRHAAVRVLAFRRWWYDVHMGASNRLEQITRAFECLQSLRPLPQAVLEELRHRYEVSLTYHSTAIEGNTLTQSETQIVIEKGITIAGKSIQEHLEIIGHKDALGFVVDLANSNELIGERQIREIHSLVMKGQDSRDSGSYRNLDVRAAGTNYVYPSHLKVQELMQEFTEWLANGSSLHPILWASEAHLKFVTIHPFRDGNGRVGRLLMNLLLLRHGYTVSVIPVFQRAQYIASLEMAQNTGDRSKLDDLVILGVSESLRDVLETALGSGELVLSPHERDVVDTCISGLIRYKEVG